MARMLGLKYDLREEQLLLSRNVPLPFSLGEDIETFDIGGSGDLHTTFPGAPVKRAIVFRDSFAAQWIPFVWQYFEEADWVWTYDFDQGRIRSQRPNLVIQQMVERQLMILQPAALENAATSGSNR